MTTALELCKNAYAETNPGQDLTSFSQQDWPYSLALGYLNKVISEMNVYSYKFMQKDTLLPYSPGTFIYDLSALGIDPGTITKVQTNTSDGLAINIAKVVPINYDDYTSYYPSSLLQNIQPRFYATYGDDLYLNNAPQLDYQVHVYHLAEIPQMVSENDIFPVPMKYQHIFQDGVKCNLLMDLSRGDGLQKYQIWQSKIKDMAAKVETDYALPTQLPRAF